MSYIEIWQRVPDGSHLEIWVESEDDSGDHPWDSRVRVLDDLGNEWIIEDHELTPGPAEHRLTTPRRYSARIRVAQMDTGSATIRARIRKPDGTTYGDPFECPFSGGAGNVVRASLGVITLQS